MRRRNFARAKRSARKGLCRWVWLVAVVGLFAVGPGNQSAVVGNQFAVAAVIRSHSAEVVAVAAEKAVAFVAVVWEEIGN